MLRKLTTQEGRAKGHDIIGYSVFVCVCACVRVCVARACCGKGGGGGGGCGGSGGEVLEARQGQCLCAPIYKLLRSHC